MALRTRLSVSVDDLSEGTRDVAFECKVLSRYGNWDPRKQLKFAYLHCDVIDRLGLTTVTVSLKTPEIEQHQAKFHVRSVLHIENFGVSMKSEKSFEKGDMPVAIKIESTTVVNVVEGKDNEFVPKFYHTDSIGEFRKRHDQWALATLAVCVIGIRGAYGRFNQLLIADGDTEIDNDIVALGPQFQVEYNQIVEAFNNGLCVMVLFKNITISQTGDRYLCTNASTIISTVVDNFVQEQLKAIHSKLCVTTQISNKEVWILFQVFFLNTYLFIIIVSSTKCNN